MSTGMRRFTTLIDKYYRRLYMRNPVQKLQTWGPVKEFLYDTSKKEFRVRSIELMRARQRSLP